MKESSHLLEVYGLENLEEKCAMQRAMLYTYRMVWLALISTINTQWISYSSHVCLIASRDDS